jgi:transposase-like protein
MTHHIGATPYERTDKRTGHRNGYKPRTLSGPIQKFVEAQ